MTDLPKTCGECEYYAQYNSLDGYCDARHTGEPILCVGYKYAPPFDCPLRPLRKDLPTGVMSGDVDDLIRAEIKPEMAPLPIQSSKYQRVIKGTVFDVYNVLKAYEVDCPARAHAIKKLLMPGKRGAKSFNQDMREAIQAIERAIELEGE